MALCFHASTTSRPQLRKGQPCHSPLDFDSSQRHCSVLHAYPLPILPRSQLRSTGNAPQKLEPPNGGPGCPLDPARIAAAAGARDRWVRRQRSGARTPCCKSGLLPPLCPALYRVTLDTSGGPRFQRTSSLQMLSVRSGQELGEGLGARRAKIRKVSWRRQHRFRTGRRIKTLLDGETGKGILGKEKNKVIEES